MTTRTIDFVSDVICPWCFIGLERLEQALAQASASGAAAPAIAFHPFQLDPTTPPEGADLRERLAAKYGVDPKSMFGRVEAAAKESGIALDFEKIRRTPNTLKAHALIGVAAGSPAQRTLVRALFEAYFLEGRDIGDDAVLLDVAAKCGIDASKAKTALTDPAAREAVQEETKELSAQGVRGVPFVVFDQKVAVSGAQPVDVFREAFERGSASP